MQIFGEKRDVMAKYRFIYNYKNNDIYRNSFNSLAKLVFGLDFQKWWDYNCWNDDYICYSYMDGEQIIANASIHKMTIVSFDKEYQAIQIGTVMTHPDYRKKGLAKKLIEHIIAIYEKQSDFIYLFANKTVLDFYPKFGFEQVEESSFTMNITDWKKTEKWDRLRKLDPGNFIDFQIMKKLASARIPVSTILGVKNSEHLLLFYFLLAFQNGIYYSDKEDAIILYEQTNGQLHVYDIISTKKVEMEPLLNTIITDETKTIHFHFAADYENVNIQSELQKEKENMLFVRPLGKNEWGQFLFPLTSHG